jgi:hypothetical protein
LKVLLPVEKELLDVGEHVQSAIVSVGLARELPRKKSTSS